MFVRSYLNEFSTDDLEVDLPDDIEVQADMCPECLVLINKWIEK